MQEERILPSWLDSFWPSAHMLDPLGRVVFLRREYTLLKSGVMRAPSLHPTVSVPGHLKFFGRQLAASEKTLLAGILWYPAILKHNRDGSLKSNELTLGTYMVCLPHSGASKAVQTISQLYIHTIARYGHTLSISLSLFGLFGLELHQRSGPSGLAKKQSNVYSYLGTCLLRISSHLQLYCVCIPASLLAVCESSNILMDLKFWAYIKNSDFRSLLPCKFFIYLMRSQFGFQPKISSYKWTEK